MRTNKLTFTIAGLVLLLSSSCERSVDGLVEPGLTQNPEVFIDGFSSGLEYYPFSGSKQNAFSVDNETTYGNTAASMRFDVPNVGDPSGAYAGAIFKDEFGGRDLSNYNALTFYIKASTASTINEVGFGQDFEDAKYLASLSGGLRVATFWQKVVIPIPDASKLTEEKGMFWYSAGPIDGNGFSFWIDELKFENLGTIGQPRPYIENGLDNQSSVFEGQSVIVSNVGITFNVADLGDISVNAAASYFTYASSNTATAQINADGGIEIVGGGSATITAELNGVAATGSVLVSAIPLAPTPPERNAADVISIFSDAYTNVPVTHYNGYWNGSTTQGQDDIDVNGNKVIKYSAINYHAIEFLEEKTIDATAMTHLHIDIYVETPLQAANTSDFIQLTLQDLGPDNSFGGSDNRAGTLTLRKTSNPALVNGAWVSIDVPLTRFPTLTTRANLSQLVFITQGTTSTDPSQITDILVDNVYFYK